MTGQKVQKPFMLACRASGLDQKRTEREGGEGEVEAQQGSKG